MYVKQIGMEEALRLAGKGQEVLVMAPGLAGKNGWTGYMPGTLAGLLEGCLFFRKEPAAEVWDRLGEGRVVSPGSQEKGGCGAGRADSEPPGSAEGPCAGCMDAGEEMEK